MVTSVYIHIPFCENICSYCDFCKLFYKEKWADKYLLALKQEVKKYYKKEKLKTIYIGGGTPSILNIKQLKQLFEIINLFNKEQDYEFTIECNIESITEEKLQLFFENGVNRISYGVQTFHEKYLKYLNRHHTKEEVNEKIKLTKSYIPNINVDLIYALKNETIDEVKKDLESFLKLDIPHISTYSLIIEPHTVIGNKKEEYMDEDIDSRMYEIICKTLKEHDYNHYEVSNFSKHDYESNHNLTYWNNEEYYGFGLGASGYIECERYTNTRSLNNYLLGNYRYEVDILTKQNEMENEMILGLRKIEGVSCEKFYQKYDKKIEEVFDIETLIKKGLLEVHENYLRIIEDKIYLSNEVLMNFIGEE